VDYRLNYTDFWKIGQATFQEAMLHCYPLGCLRKGNQTRPRSPESTPKSKDFFWKVIE